MGCTSSKYEDKRYWLKKCRKNGLKLLSAPKEMQADKEVVMTAIEQLPYTLALASQDLKSDKEVIMTAVKRNGLTLHYAADDMKSNKEIVMAAVEQEGQALQYASDELRLMKEVVLAAVKQNPVSLKYALGGLNQDHECLAMAGLFDDRYDKLSDANATRAVMSTKFSLGWYTPDYATKLALLLKKNPFFRDIIVYFPNSWNKNTCDPEWTNINHPCRGTFETCGKPAELKIGVPKEKESCWRYSFRYQLEKAKETGGFMIQVAEYLRDEGRHTLGHGQHIETELAKQVGVKIFRIYQNPADPFSNVEDDLKGFIKCVKSWFDTGCENMSLTEYKFGEEKMRSPFHKSLFKVSIRSNSKKSNDDCRPRTMAYIPKNRRRKIRKKSSLIEQLVQILNHEQVLQPHKLYSVAKLLSDF